MIIAICYDMPTTQELAPDLQDTLEQVKYVEEHLTLLGHTVKIIPYMGRSQEFINNLKATNPNVVWNLFESFQGSEAEQFKGVMLLESAEISFTGSSVQSMMFCADKTITNNILKEAGINVPFQYVLNDTEEMPANLYKWIFKPAKLHGSVAISDKSVMELYSEKEVVEILNRARPELEIYAEEYIDGREFSVTLLDRGLGLLPIAVAEMRFINYPQDKPKILNYNSKWDEESEDFKNTKRTFNHAPEDRAMVAEMIDIAAKTASVLNLEGFARIDFRCDAGRTPWVIDVNPNPGLGDDSGFMAACRRAGLTPEKAIDAIIWAVKR